MPRFEVISDITNQEVIARGVGVRVKSELKKKYGGSKWRKLKGEATIELPDGWIGRAELHWYEAHGIGKRGMKIKDFID